MDTQTKTRPTGNTSEDGALVRAALGGDKSAMDLLIERHRPRLVAFCRRRTHDRDLAEDIAQEVLLRALAHLESFDTRRAMWPWLKHIAANLAIDHERKHCRETVGLPDASAEEVEVEVDPLAAIDERCLVDEALREVPARQVAAIELYYFEDWTASEAAAFFDTNRRAMQQLLHRARNSFRTAYEHTGGRVAGGFALPFGARIRDLVDRARARFGAWDLPLEASAPGFGAAAASVLVVAATVAGAGALMIERGDAPVPLGSPVVVSTHEELAARGADDPVTTATDLPEPPSRDAPFAATTAPAPDGDTTRSIRRVSVAPPSTGVLEDGTNADTGAEQDEDEASVNTKLELDPPGEALDGTTSGDLVWVSCEFPYSAVCDGLDQVPDED